jgi:hypothetical protein
MAALFVVLGVLLVLAVVAIAVWLWLFLDIVDQVTELIRIRVEERLALWRIDAISRITQLEQRVLREQHRRPTPKDR